jgi:apoptosis-inducing factor 3
VPDVDRLWLRVASVSELAGARRMVCSAGGAQVLLLQLAESIVAVSNTCTHLGQPLDKGRVIAGQLHCPFHGACFDLATGEALAGPAVAPLPLYDVKIEGQDVLIAPRFASPNRSGIV